MIHCALKRIKEVYRGISTDLNLAMISHRDAKGDIISTVTNDSVLSYYQTLEAHIRTLELRVRRDTKKIKQLMNHELDLEADAREANYEHEDEVKDFLERIKKLKTPVANLEEQLDMGENLHPEGDNAPLMNNEDDYEESTTGGGCTTMDF